ncbi:amidase [Xylariaceae sp. FL1272]|nr:amidase [Xylariaceae sp. FL1272]
MSPKYFTPQLSRRAKSQGPGLFPVDKLKGVSVFEISIQELQSHFSDGYFTSVDYVGLCLKRIREVDEYIEAVIEVNPDAMAIAQDLDKERDAGVVRGPLHGVPVLVKDNIATKDAMQTTAGSWALLGSVVPKGHADTGYGLDAFVVSKLRRAGAVIIGHANMSEWASLRSKTYSTGYSPRGGQVRNPFDLTKSPFGSSSGSAAAVSANFVPVAFGSETDTSIIGPASINGVVGIKPTVGLTSRAGVIPISRHMDSVGPIARTVADAVFALDATVGEDPDDLATASPGRCGEDLRYSQFLSSAEALRGARFGLPMKRCWDLVPPSCKAVATNVLEAMKRAGAEIVEVELPSVGYERVNESGTWDWEHGDPAHSEWTVAKIDAYNGINSYLQNLAESPVRSLEEIIEYNVQNVGTEGGLPGVVPAFDGQPNFEEMAQSKGVEDETYKSALSHIRRQTRENGLDSALMYGNSVLDALIFCDRRGIGQQYAAQAGYPIICIPIGLDNHGMPISLSFQHTAWGESKLVKWASAVEDLWNKENGWRAIPTFHNVHAKNMPIEKVVND